MVEPSLTIGANLDLQFKTGFIPETLYASSLSDYRVQRAASKYTLNNSNLNLRLSVPMIMSRYSLFNILLLTLLTLENEQIYEGSTSQSPEVGKFCGSDTPADYISTSNVLMIAFKSDWSLSQEGFRLGYEIGKIQWKVI